MYDFESSSVKKFLREENVSRACVQLPSGLRPYAADIKKDYDEEDVEVLFLSDSCYGACFVADKRARELGCDGLVHYGHADMGVPTSLPTFYVEAREKLESLDFLEELLPKLEGSKWGLTATVQYVGYLDRVKDYLKEKSIESVIGEPGPRSKYPGQILGCDWGSAQSIEDEVDAFLYFGSGEFHPKGISLATGKPVYSLDPATGVFEPLEFDKNDFLKKRYAAIDKAKSANKFGILVSTMQGQFRLSLALDLSDGLEQKDYETLVLPMEELNPEILADYRLDVLVNTACSRIPYDDLNSYGVPILTPYEVEVLLGREEWGDYRLDQMKAAF